MAASHYTRHVSAHAGQNASYYSIHVLQSSLPNSKLSEYPVRMRIHQIPTKHFVQIVIYTQICTLRSRHTFNQRHQDGNLMVHFFKECLIL